MLTPEFEQAQHRIETLTKKWHKLMDMSWLSIKHTYNPNIDDDEPFTVATTQADWEYRAAVIDWHLPRVCAIEDETLESVVVHEFVHVLVAAMEVNLKPNHDSHAEFAVESVARAILSVRGADA